MLYVLPADRVEINALTSNRNTPCKLVWRGGGVLCTAPSRSWEGRAGPLQHFGAGMSSIPLGQAGKLSAGFLFVLESDEEGREDDEL